MEFIVENWYIIVALLAVGFLGGVLVVKFINLDDVVKLTKIKKWLVYACLEAEKALGTDTGKAKLLMVYNLFTDKFTFASKLISFDKFSEMVDEALVEVRIMLENDSLKNYVYGE